MIQFANIVVRADHQERFLLRRDEGETISRPLREQLTDTVEHVAILRLRVVSVWQSNQNVP